MKHFETVIANVLTANKITLPKTTKFLRRSERCGIDTTKTIPASVLTKIQAELTRVHDLLPEPVPDPVVPIEAVTLDVVYAKLKEIDTKLTP